MFEFLRKRTVDDQSRHAALPADQMALASRASDEVFDALVKPMKLQRGVPSAVIAHTLGALAGHACQRAALMGIGAGDPAYVRLSVLEITGANGDRYFAGDAINRPVMESPHSVWALVAGVTQKMGHPVPDLDRLVTRVASDMGTASFDRAIDLTADAPPARTLTSLFGIVTALGAKMHLDAVPVAIALAYQRLAQTDNDVDPSVDVVALARIMMESTIAMSKLQLTTERRSNEAAVGVP